ncbi:MAG: TetR family transcriptional regulator [Parasphingorhabdus sp.]|nr:TetR family transcriptional regulator [Parasphingorhabdus sp.]
MGRPKADKEAMRGRFFLAAEEVLKESGGKSLALANVAAALGMSQSNGYRYFNSKDDLVSALADRWFAGVELAVADAMARVEGPEQKIHAWVLGTMNEKVRRYDDDPALFLAYLELANGHYEAALVHVQRLRQMAKAPVAELTGTANVEAALDLLENATVLFRNPYLVQRNREKLTIATAMAVLEAIIGGIKASANVR